MTILATLNLAIFYELGTGEGLTLSVVKDMRRKSPKIMRKVIRSGLRLAAASHDLAGSNLTQVASRSRVARS